jgi:hypothetical protein
MPSSFPLAKRQPLMPRQSASSTSENPLQAILPAYLAPTINIEEDKQEGLQLPKINQPRVSKARVHTEV